MYMISKHQAKQVADAVKDFFKLAVSWPTNVRINIQEENTA